MCTDHRSACKQHGLWLRDAMVREWYGGREALLNEGIAGATRFASGLGRHGDFESI